MKARIKRLILSPMALVKLFSTDTVWRVEAGIPKTAELRGFCIDSSTQNLVLFIEDDSFSLVDITNEVSSLLVLEVRKIQ